MEQAILNFAKQFEYNPVVENADKLQPADSFVIGGMGGSNLASGILKMINPDLDIYVHRDYGVPVLAKKRFKNSLYIASSYSGNTEETLSFAADAQANGYNVAVISTGGKLIAFAKEQGLAYIQLPAEGIQPRSALGLSLLALARLIGDDDDVAEIQTRGQQLNPESFRKRGEGVARELAGKVPIIYSTRELLPIAYNWKIKFNETAKIPAFYNTLPELNHNEMTGFDVIEGTTNLSSNFAFIFVTVDSEMPARAKRIDVLMKLYAERGFPVEEINFSDGSITKFEEIFYSLLTADWAALSLSKAYGTEAEQVPMVEEFKRLIS